MDSGELACVFKSLEPNLSSGHRLEELGVVMERKLLRKACAKILGLPTASSEMKLFLEMCFIKQSSIQARALRV